MSSPLRHWCCTGNSYASAALLNRLPKRKSRKEVRHTQMMLGAVTKEMEMSSVKVEALDGKFSMNVKGRLQSLLRMCDRFVMRSLLITSFQSHGVNGNTRGHLDHSLLYCKERWRIKSWHKNCCFESFKIKQLIYIGF